jgi:hypothetical protein
MDRKINKTKGMKNTKKNFELNFGAAIFAAFIALILASAAVSADCLDLDKTASETTVASGESVKYIYTVTNNCGKTVSGIKVSDDVLGDICSKTSLYDGNTMECDKTAVLTETTTNVGSVSGYYRRWSNKVYLYDKDSVTVTVTKQVTSDSYEITGSDSNPMGGAIKVVKTASLDGTCPGLDQLLGISIGNEVTYCYNVTNTGGIALTDITLGDDKLSGVNVTANCDPAKTTLEPQDSMTCTAKTNIFYDTENNATVTGQYCVGGAGFLLIDEDSIDNGNPPNFFSDVDVNDDIADIGLRNQLRYFKNHIGKEITLYTGEVGDEGWFALKTIPDSWANAGPTDDGLQNYLGTSNPVGSGLGSGKDPEARLDKIPDVTPLRADGLKMLEGNEVCAVVYDSDISINYDPLDGSLKGDNLGIVAFEVIEVKRLFGYSSGSLPEVKIKILDADDVCTRSLALYKDAPEHDSSSEPYDIKPDIIPGLVPFGSGGETSQGCYTVMGWDTALVTISNPSIGLVKTADWSISTYNSEVFTVNYTYVIKNTGDVNLTGINLTDSVSTGDLGPITCEPPIEEGLVLAPYAQMTCNATTEYTGSDFTSEGLLNITNTATVGAKGDGKPVSANDTCMVTCTFFGEISCTVEC